MTGQAKYVVPHAYVFSFNCVPFPPKTSSLSKMDPLLVFAILQFIHACDLKGHTDWIRSLDFSLPIRSNGETVSLQLVSSSQDKGIRMWKIALSYGREEMSLASYIKGPIFAVGSSSYQVSMESLLIGHEDWVYSVEWQPPLVSSADGIECFQPQSILSASMDKTMMVWQPEKTAGIWMNVVTVGELSHCALGFYGGHWSSTGDSILAHGYGGSFHLWRNIGVDSEDWKPQKVPSGHFGSVSDIAWARCGEYMLSVSHDQVMLEKACSDLFSDEIFFCPFLVVVLVC